MQPSFIKKVKERKEHSVLFIKNAKERENVLFFWKERLLNPANSSDDILPCPLMYSMPPTKENYEAVVQKTFTFTSLVYLFLFLLVRNYFVYSFLLWPNLLTMFYTSTWCIMAALILIHCVLCTALYSFVQHIRLLIRNLSLCSNTVQADLSHKKQVDKLNFVFCLKVSIPRFALNFFEQFFVDSCHYIYIPVWFNMLTR